MSLLGFVLNGYNNQYDKANMVPICMITDSMYSRYSSCCLIKLHTPHNKTHNNIFHYLYRLVYKN